MAKVNKKIFVFMGVEDSPELGMSVKLRESHEQAMSVPGATPTGYGLGRAGWVSIPFRATTPPIDVLRDWIEERLVRPEGGAEPFARRGAAKLRRRLELPSCGAQAAGGRTRRTPDASLTGYR